MFEKSKLTVFLTAIQRKIKAYLVLFQMYLQFATEVGI